jgi:hypothetical protein
MLFHSCSKNSGLCKITVVVVNHQPVPPWLANRLHEIPGLDVELDATHDKLLLRVSGGPSVAFRIESVPVLSRERAAQLAKTANIPAGSNPGAARLIIATRQLTEPLRKLLRGSDLSWVERDTGYCRLLGPGLLIDITADRSPVHESKEVRARLRDKSGLLAEVLLNCGPNERFAAGDIAVRAAISLGLASRILKRLTGLKIVMRVGKGPVGYWQLADPGALLDLWGAEERARPAVSKGVYVWSRSPAALYDKLSRLQLDTDWALGGVGAANVYAPTLTVYPDPVVWVAERTPAEEVAMALGGEVAETGANMHIWQSAGDMPLRHAVTSGAAEPARIGGQFQGLRLVSRARAYIETFGAPGRAAEVAQSLRTQLLSTT